MADPSSPLTLMASGLTVDGTFRTQALLNPDRIAVEAYGRQYSYAQLRTRVNRTAHALTALGLTRGDRFALLSENRVEYLEIELAAAALGAILCCLNWRQSPRELAHCIGLAAPRFTLSSQRHRAVLDKVDADCGRIVDLDDEFGALVERASDAEPPAIAEPEDGFLIIYTSGTTGLPKGALISQRAEVMRAVIGLTDGQIYVDHPTIAWGPFFHISGTDQALASVLVGGKIHITDGFVPADLIAIMEREALGNLTLMPAAIDKLLAEIAARDFRPKGVISCGGMADLVPRHLIAECSRVLNAEFRNTFGATETGQPPASRHRFPVGVAPEDMGKEQSSFCQIRLVDEDDREVPTGEPGEVCIRAPSLFSGYWGQPDVTAEDFRGGWFHMGDVMIRRPDGKLDFVDRRKYLIKSGGENIYPAEIEQVLMASDRIGDVAVVRRQDDFWGEVPVAFIVRNDPALRREDVLALLDGRVARYKLPKDVHFIEKEDLPRSETGKIQRFVLESRLTAS